jgi:large subunit ribosomal protein L16
MLMPKKTKYRKIQKGKMKGRSKGARSLFFGDYGLVALEPGRITARQIEAVRVTLSRRLKKVGALFLRIFPDRSITKKAAETRMGKGKGNPEYWVSIVKRERIVCEISGVDIVAAKRILKAAAYKLPIKTKFISKENPELVTS